MWRARSALAAGVVIAACGRDESSSSENGPPRDGTTIDDGTVAPTTTCLAEGGTTPVAAPTFVRNIRTGETGWYASPAVADLDGDGKMEIVAALYSTFVFGVDGTPRGAKATA